MLLKKKMREERIGPLKGWKRVLYYTGRFFLFPLRRPIITLLILLILFLAPTFRGVKPVNVHKWYASQFSNMCNKVLVWWGSREPEVTPGEFKFHPEEAAPAPVTPSEFTIPEPIDANAPNILEVLRGDNKPSQTEETKEEKTAEVKFEPKIKDVKPEIKEETASKNAIRLPKDASLYSYPQDKKVYALKYLDIPHEVFGKAKVHNCNEIEINGEFIMMYGIYVHPYTAKGTSATEYLKSLIDGKDVKCGIVAYTDQNIATGICYFGGENINRSLVLKGYTKNVAL